MHRGVLAACLPWLLALLALVLVLRWLLLLSGARLRWVRLAGLHHDQQGGVQSLSFVLTLPVFVMVLLLIVQVSQLMIAQIMVEYAAVAAARAAMVWIPANLNGGTESENRISSYQFDTDQSNTGGGIRYLINPGSPKFEHIRMAAVLACLPIAPSRSVGANPPDNGAIAPALASTYLAMAPRAASNNKIATRIQNKLAYSNANTTIQLRFVHPDSELPLTTWFVPADWGEFYSNEVGWQDTLEVTVIHQLALLPGPGRLLWSKAASPSGATDQVSQRIKRVNNNVYTYQLKSAASLGNEGEKSVLSYVHSSF